MNQLSATIQTRCTLLAMAVLAPTAAAGSLQVVSTLGPGGPIPDSPYETCPFNISPLGWPALVSPVTLPQRIDHVTAIEIQGLHHSFRRDVHIYLENPAGQRFNVVVCPGYGNEPGCTLESGSFQLGTYTFVESGGSSVLHGAANIEGGTYNQHLNLSCTPWTYAGYPIANVPLSAITGGAGTWKLHVRDWCLEIAGSISAWRLYGEYDGDVAALCFGDASNIETPCPCTPGASQAGCANSSGAGAVLSGTGSASIAANDLRLQCSGMLPGSASMFFQSTNALNSGFGVLGNTTDGIECLSPFTIRIDRRGTIGSVASINDIVSQGGLPFAGGLRVYQVRYRDVANYCTPAAWNTSNAVRVWWMP